MFQFDSLNFSSWRNENNIPLGTYLLYMMCTYINTPKTKIFVKIKIFFSSAIFRNIIMRKRMGNADENWYAKS